MADTNRNSMSSAEQEVIKGISMQIVDRCRAAFGAFLSVAADESAQDHIRSVLRDGGHLRVEVDLRENENATVTLVLRHSAVGDCTLADMALQTGHAKGATMQ